MSCEIATVPKCKSATCSYARLGYLNTHTSFVFYSKVKVKCAHDCVFFPRVSNFAAQLPSGAQYFDVVQKIHYRFLRLILYDHFCHFFLGASFSRKTPTGVLLEEPQKTNPLWLFPSFYCGFFD